MTSHSPKTRWTRQQIRAARVVPLAPLLQKRDLLLVQREAGNFISPGYPGLTGSASSRDS